MIVTNLIENIMWISFLIVFLFYIYYFLLLYSYHRKAQRNKQSFEFIYPTISLIVPVYNEERIIAKKLQNIEELNYPREKLQVLFVDGHSTDETPEIIGKHAIEHNNVRVIKQDKREGYTYGVIQGVVSSSGEIVVITDAAAYHDSDAIRHLVKHFRDCRVGAVTGKEIVLTEDGKLAPKLEASYRGFFEFMSEAETQIDSTLEPRGEILAIKRDICKSIIKRLELSPNASFDSCVPFQAKLMGYRTVYEPQAKYKEYPPISFMDRMRQQTRRATVRIGALFLYKEMLLARKYGKFGLLIMPSHFIMHCILPWLFFLGCGSLLVLTALLPVKTLLLWIIALGTIVATRKSRYFLISFIQSQAALVSGIFRLATRRESLFIATIPSTRR
jgi:glycosyltransferase involved in cell wall biosynthesis